MLYETQLIDLICLCLTTNEWVYTNYIVGPNPWFTSIFLFPDRVNSKRFLSVAFYKISFDVM